MEYLKRAPEVSEADRRELTMQVMDVLADIRENGEAAVRKYSEQFDEWSPESFRVSDEEIAAAADEVPDDLKETFAFAHEQVRNFAQAQRETLRDLDLESRPGVMLGHRHVPVSSVGAYVPGGRYTMIGSGYMSVIPAKVAGVERVVVCTPPTGGRVPPAMLYSTNLAGADEIYALGGTQALAAMAYGALPGLEPVDMLVGPGNQYVYEAKRQLFGEVGIDLLAGPTEIAVLADETADPFLVACDLVGQAEHDPNSRAILITTSRELGQSVIDQMDDHLQAVSTEEVARECWENGGEVIIVDDEDELVNVSDDYAIEHVEVMVREPERMIERLRNYGALFVGEESTVAYGDKVSGPNHILPTLRASRYTGGLWVGKYLKALTYEYMTVEASVEMARHCEIESHAEGMDAHARTATVRLERYAAEKTEQDQVS
jgi:sulfopropanediol 3-dehydrogenase